MGIALQQNRDVVSARARIEEYRADAGEARSYFFPSLTLNGSASRNKVAFGSTLIPPYTAWRATADLAWELSFWGTRQRHRGRPTPTWRRRWRPSAPPCSRW